MVTQDGQPVECFLTPGGFGDVDALKYYAYELPDGSIIYADKAYNDYEIEDLLQEVDHIQLIPIRKKNSKRALPPYISFVQRYHRKSSVAERLTNASAWYSWHREEVTHGYHQAMGARWRRRASGDRVGRTRPSRYSQRRVDGRISLVCD